MELILVYIGLLTHEKTAKIKPLKNFALYSIIILYYVSYGSYKICIIII